MGKVYVVEGCTGEYSDRSEWPVAAYLDKALAEKHAAMCHADAERWERMSDDEKDAWRNRMNDRDGYLAPPAGWSKADPDMRVDYTGTAYVILEVELRDCLPPAL